MLTFCVIFKWIPPKYVRSKLLRAAKSYGLEMRMDYAFPHFPFAIKIGLLALYCKIHVFKIRESEKNVFHGNGCSCKMKPLHASLKRQELSTIPFFLAQKTL